MLFDNNDKGCVFSGIQPTGILHIGNYFGALKEFQALQNTSNLDCIFCAVDLHALTVRQDSESLRQNIQNTIATFLACGLDPEKSVIFVQSDNPDHTYLCWLLSCVARIGWLNRMTQFKDKARSKEGASSKSSVGLYSYPILMAADILAYGATHVPVGEDQKQHLELVRQIVQGANEFYKQPLFAKPKDISSKITARVMSLRDGSKKMSKSDPSNASRIVLTDQEDAITRKISKAKTDSFPLPEHIGDLANRAEAKNLLALTSTLAGESLEVTVQKFAGKPFSLLKKSLIDMLIEEICPIGREIARRLEDIPTLHKIMEDGALKARERSHPIIQKVKKVHGLIY